MDNIESLSVEQILLARALRSKQDALEVLSKTTVDMYEELKHKELFETIKQLVYEGKEPDLVVVSNELKKKGSKIDTYYLAEMIGHDLDTFASLETLTKELTIQTRNYRARLAVEQARQDLAAGKDGAINELTTQLLQLSVGFDKTVFSASELATEHFNILEERRKNGGIAGIPYGFLDLDDYTSGAKPGQLILIAARTSQGKSAFAENIVTNMLQDGKKVYFVSVETGRQEIMDRMIGRLSGVGHNRLMQGINDESNQWGEVAKAFGIVNDFKLTLHDNPSITSDQIFAEATKLKLQNSVDVVVVDYLQLLKDPAGKNETRERQVARMSQNLKELARRINVPVIVTAQLNRDAVGGATRPQLHHLRESGALEQDADVAILLWRGGADEPNLTHFDVAKNRQGRVGEFDLRFNGELTKFDNITALYPEQVPQLRGGEQYAEVADYNGY